MNAEGMDIPLSQNGSRAKITALRGVRKKRWHGCGKRVVGVYKRMVAQDMGNRAYTFMEISNILCIKVYDN